MIDKRKVEELAAQATRNILRVISDHGGIIPAAENKLAEIQTIGREIVADAIRKSEEFTIR